MSAIALHHAWNDEARHREQTLDIRVDHRLPVIKITLILRFQSQRQTSVVHQHVYLLPLSRQFLDVLCSLLAVSHVESQRQNFRTFFH